MKKLSENFAREISLTRRFGTRVQLAGKIVFLPNRKVPRAVQKLKLAQITAIPRDRYSVKVIDLTQPSKVIPVHKNRRMILSARRERLRSHGHCGRVTRAFSLKVPEAQIVPETFSFKADSTKEYLTFIEIINQLSKEGIRLYYENHELKRKLENDPPEDSGIFFSPINEDEMSDCIQQIIMHFFGTEDTGVIRDETYKLPQFCVLMYYYFRRIKVLRNTSRQPFCHYLLKKVFEDKSKFTSRTFNNYTTDPDYLEVEEDFTNEKRLSINFKYHPLPSGNPLQDAFHEIGWAFHHSKYFEKLRELQRHVKKFMI